MKLQNLLAFLPIGLSIALAHHATPTDVSPVVDALPCNIRCRTGYHLYTSPTTGKCSCVPDSTKEICLTATICEVGSQPVWDETTKTCSCLPNKPVDPCAEIMCIAEKHPVYNAETKTCSCEWIPGLEPGNPTTRDVPEANTECGDTVCTSEMHGVFNTATKQCQCEWIPGLEPGTSIEEREAKTASVTVKSCKGVVCISEKHAVYNATSKLCECEWISGMEPGLPVTLSFRAENPIGPKPKPTPKTTSKGLIKGGCQEIICIATHTPWYNATSGICECIPIDVKPIAKREEETKPTDATPNPTRPACENLKIYCECGDHYMHWDPLKEKCACPQCPTTPPKPTQTKLPCESMEIYCECGDHVMHWNEKEGKCACPTADCPKLTFTTKTLVPEPTVTLGCEGLKIWCEGGDHKMHLNAVTKKCECPPIKP